MVQLLLAKRLQVPRLRVLTFMSSGIRLPYVYPNLSHQELAGIIRRCIQRMRFSYSPETTRGAERAK